MSDMKCPFCQQELKYDSWNEVYMCRNPNCNHLLGYGTKELWQALIDTRKALDVAVDALIGIEDGVDNLYIAQATASDALEQIESITKGGKDE